MRHLAQRFLTSLPWRIRPFAALSSAASRSDLALLREEAGVQFYVQPARFFGEVPFDTPHTALCKNEPTRRLFQIENAGVYDNEGAVYDIASRSFIEETMDDWHGPLRSHKALSAPRFPGRERLRGTSFCATTLGGESFYHFLFDALPRVLWARDMLDSCDHLLLNYGLEAAKVRWLRACGINREVRFVGRLSHLECDRLLFTNRLVAHFEPNPWAVKILKAFLSPAGAGVRAPTEISDGQKVLWLDRRSATARNTPWESALLSRLPRLHPVEFHHRTPSEVIATCNAVRGAAGLHGAAFANMIFFPPGARTAELCLDAPYRPWYANLASLCGLDHHVIMLDNAADPFGRADNALRQLFPS